MTAPRGPYKLRHPPPAEETLPVTDEEYLDSLRAENNRLRMHLRYLIATVNRLANEGIMHRSPALQDALDSARKLLDTSPP